MSPAYSQLGERIKLCVVYVYVVYRLCVHVYARAYVCPVCVHVCTFYVYVYVRVYSCMQCTHMHACMCERLCTLCLHVCARVYACVHVSVYACVCARDCLTSLRGQPR